KNRRAPKKKYGGEKIARDNASPSLEPRPAGDSHHTSCSANIRAELLQSHFGVVSGADALFDGCVALGKEARKQHCGLYLSAGNWKRILYGLQSRTADFEGSKIGVARLNMRSHALQR